MTTREQALAKHLNVDESELEVSQSNHNAWVYGRGEYLVLTDDEATEECIPYMKENLWSFDPHFLADYIDCDDKDALIESLRIIQNKMCESANPVVHALVKDKLSDLIVEAIGLDGRGHFMSFYDGEEHESLGYYIYRID